MLKSTKTHGLWCIDISCVETSSKVERLRLEIETMLPTFLFGLDTVSWDNSHGNAIIIPNQENFSMHKFAWLKNFVTSTKQHWITIMVIASSLQQKLFEPHLVLLAKVLVMDSRLEMKFYTSCIGTKSKSVREEKIREPFTNSGTRSYTITQLLMIFQFVKHYLLFWEQIKCLSIGESSQKMESQKSVSLHMSEILLGNHHIFLLLYLALKIICIFWKRCIVLMIFSFC